MNNRTKQLTTLAMLTAMAYMIGFFIRIRFMPGAPFLTYDPKDVFIIIGGFMFGPLAALTMSFVLALVEMVTISQSGPIGALMNFLASAAIACPAAFVYKRWRNLKGAVIGLIIGAIAATAIMLLWNYLLTPIFMGVPRHVVVDMLVPIILPFNLIKTGLNGSIAMLLYKPISIALRAAKLYKPEAAANATSTSQLNLGVLIVSAFVVISLIMVILAMQGVF